MQIDDQLRALAEHARENKRFSEGEWQRIEQLSRIRRRRRGGTALAAVAVAVAVGGSYGFVHDWTKDSPASDGQSVSGVPITISVPTYDGGFQTGGAVPTVPMAGGSGVLRIKADGCVIVERSGSTSDMSLVLPTGSFAEREGGTTTLTIPDAAGRSLVFSDGDHVGVGGSVLSDSLPAHDPCLEGTGTAQLMVQSIQSTR